MLDRLLKKRLRLLEIAAGVQEAIDLRAILGPLFNLVKVAIVRIERVVSFFRKRDVARWEGRHGRMEK